MRAAAQLPQSGYSPLPVPYTLLGLGQTNDYVEDLRVGVPSGSVNLYGSEVVSNSRLLIIPYPWDGPSYWEMRLYLDPRQQLAVGLSLLGLLLLLGGAIGCLESRERRQDAIERKLQRPAMPL